MSRIERWLLARTWELLGSKHPIGGWAWRRLCGPPYATEQEKEQILADIRAMQTGPYR